MKVLMLKDVKKIGQKGTVLDVADGYANSFLLPRKMAKIATQSDIQNTYKLTEAREKQSQEKIAKEQDLFKRLNKKTATIQAAANTNGQLFAAIQKTDITQQLPGLKPEHIVLKDALKQIGDYEVPILIGTNKGNIFAKITTK